MKKFVLNIERLYTGATANALVLSQVDEDFPVLLPSLTIEHDGETTFGEWKSRCLELYSMFDPIGHEYEVKFDNINPNRYPIIVKGKFLQAVRIPTTTTMVQAAQMVVEHPSGDHQWHTETTVFDLFNSYILDFNLERQRDFRRNGHDELYLMDDTQWRKPINADATYSSDKTYMHSINGLGDIESGDDKVEVVSSQMNVLFPFKKVSSKSLYAAQLDVKSAGAVDDAMERSRTITMQGKDTQQQCVNGTAVVGGHLYVMSSLLNTLFPSRSGGKPNLSSNGWQMLNSMVVGNVDDAYAFPHTMTLFQPSGEHSGDDNLQGVTEFAEWYGMHDRKTVVSLSEEYGGNTSYLWCLCAGAYELKLSTHGPTSIVLGKEDGKGEVPLSASSFLKMRSGEDELNKYADGRYIVNNGGKGTSVGFKFNLYDNFISGQYRRLVVKVPKDKDFDHLLLQFKCQTLLDDLIGTEAEYRLLVNGEQASADSDGWITHHIDNAVSKDHEVEIGILVHYGVDFNRRNTEGIYQDMLKNAGVVLWDIHLEKKKNDVGSQKEHLTFADYVNENGISQKEWERRYDQFWQVSRYIKDMPYQTVLETPLKNMSGSGIAFANNYSTGDIYGDTFATKSVLNPQYDMELDEAKGILKSKGREYIGMGNCSSQLFLLYQPTQVEIGKSGEVYAYASKLAGVEDELGFQMVEVVKNINRFESSIKHKPNVFSVVVENSNLEPDENSQDSEIEDYKQQLRNSISQYIRSACEGITPAHTQLVKVQFT